MAGLQGPDTAFAGGIPPGPKDERGVPWRPSARGCQTERTVREWRRADAADTETTATRPPAPARRPAPRAAPTGLPTADIGALLFPGGQPPLPEAIHVNGERMDLRCVVSVLRGHRDAVHRWAAETGRATVG